MKRCSSTTLRDTAAITGLSAATTTDSPDDDADVDVCESLVTFDGAGEVDSSCVTVGRRDNGGRGDGDDAGITTAGSEI